MPHRLDPITLNRNLLALPIPVQQMPLLVNPLHGMHYRLRTGYRDRTLHPDCPDSEIGIEAVSVGLAWDYPDCART